MFRISSGFQNSVNIRYDLDNPKKISSYIPTENAIILLEDLAGALKEESTERARIVIGPYGTGKSHLVTLYASMLKGTLAPEIFQPVFEKLQGARKTQLVNTFKQIVGKKKYLTVVLSGNEKPLKQAFLYGLSQALEKANLNQLIPKTVYSEILDQIEVWKSKYPDTLKQFKQLLNKEDMTYSKFLTLVNEYDEKSYLLFEKIFPAVTSGTKFNPFNSENIDEIYLDIARQLKQHGFEGILIVFDEFNKYLEEAVKGSNIDLKPIQDLAEMCNRSEDNQVHLLLVSHQHISQYASKLSQELVNEWRKVEGRFKAFELTPKTSKTYHLISKVIIKEQIKWKQFKDKFKDQFSWLAGKTNVFGLFKTLQEQELKEWVIEGCYPLHPVTTFALPRISNKIAQNERTIFTFLASNDFNTLGRFIEHFNEEDFQLLTPDILFDYFSDIMKKQDHQDDIYKTWVNVNRALQKADQDSELETKIVKVLGLIKAVAEEQSLPPTAELLQFALMIKEDEAEEFNEALSNLIHSKVIYERKSDGYIQFFQGSDIDFEQEIQKVLGTKKHHSLFNVSSILNTHFSPSFIVANKYNDEYDITRFFHPVYVTVKELKKGFDWDEEIVTRNYADGLIVYTIPETENEVLKAEEISTNVKHPQVIIAVPNGSINIKNAAFYYQALDCLRRDKKFLEKDPSASIEINAYLEDYRGQVEQWLSKVIAPRNNPISFYYQGSKRTDITSPRQLSRWVSDICLKIFAKTPKINNEMVNKTSVTSPIAKARKKVVDGLLEQEPQVNLGLKGYGPDVSIFRSAIKSTGIYSEKDGKVELLAPKEDNLKLVLDRIRSLLKTDGENVLNFESIYTELRKPPYGIRLGIIPLILALAFRPYKDVLIVKNQKGVEEPLSGELLEKINKAPDQFILTIEDWDIGKQNYLNELGKLFQENLEGINHNSNKLYPIAMALKQWYISLSKFARETNQISKEANSFRKALKKPSGDSKQLLFNQLPQFIDASIQFDSSKVDYYVNVIRAAKDELESFIPDVLRNLDYEISRLFNGNNSLSAIKDWYESLEVETQNHMFEGLSGLVFNVVRSFEGYSNDLFLKKLIKEVAGLRIEDWSDYTYNEFLTNLNQAKQHIEQFNSQALTNEHISSKLVKIQVFDDVGEKVEYSFERCEISQLGQLLLNNLQSSIDGFADSISTNEKREILLTLLNKIS
jgi:hypothetical protein